MSRKWWWFILVGAVVLALALAAGVGALIRGNSLNGWQAAV